MIVKLAAENRLNLTLDRVIKLLGFCFRMNT